MINYQSSQNRRAHLAYVAWTPGLPQSWKLVPMISGSGTYGGKECERRCIAFSGLAIGKSFVIPSKSTLSIAVAPAVARQVLRGNA